MWYLQFDIYMSERLKKCEGKLPGSFNEQNLRERSVKYAAFATDNVKSTPVISNEYCKQKMYKFVNSTTYRKLLRNPTTQFLRKTDDLIKVAFFLKDKKKFLRKSEALPPRVYGLLKIHKQNVTFI